jgi:hypothetical protein
VLNADDRLLVEVSRKERILRVPKKIVFFSMDPMNTAVHEHVAAGGTAYVLHGAWIEEHAAESQRRLIRAADIPVTLGGLGRLSSGELRWQLLACGDRRRGRPRRRSVGTKGISQRPG